MYFPRLEKIESVCNYDVSKSILIQEKYIERRKRMK